ncbi:neutral zinc metallopeptidase [Actinocrispum sp. NPDC049592]|uniref:neutral zinc metallopeptidase n=1 Tax=Actinocrispum sp. NPDC049592 TaxID=3154835 RepID=UPI0034280012
MARSSVFAILAVGVALLASACTTTVVGVPVAAGGVINRNQGGDVDPSFINNTDGGEIDKLAGTVVKDVEKYWMDTFPATFDNKAWEPLRGGYYSVDTKSPKAPAPPCTDQASDVEGNAFYCPSADAIAWDRAALLPLLKENFGEASVMLVLAHEMGHAVQRRAGITPQAERANPQKYPTILLEAQADCYAGSFVRWVTEGKAARLQVERTALDPALEAMVVFRDPVGTTAGAQGAHGDAFDRVSAFQDGFEKGASLCAKMSVDNREFTQKGFESQQDKATGGNISLAETLKGIDEDINPYLQQQVTKLGKQWKQPKLKEVTSEPECGSGDQGPVAFCQDSDEVDVESGGQLAEIHKEIGDWSTGTIISSRYGLGVLAALNKPLTGRDAQKAVLCVAGAYSGQLLNKDDGYRLSPGDLDEAVQVLLRYDYAARDLKGDAPETGFERVSDFRVGAVGGFPACKLG